TTYVEAMLAQVPAQAPENALERVVLGCTHYPLLEAHFRDALPSTIRLLAQPTAVADSLDDYFTRHPHYAVREEASPGSEGRQVTMLTTGPAARDADPHSGALRAFWPDLPPFEPIGT
ncbi:MAG: hypothetical protein AAFQ35_15020, partial [Pseudomonadota bacterium]